jgi:hypothetical protein
MDWTSLANLFGGIGLGSASGLNPWIPLLGVGIAARTDVVTLSPSFDWLGSNQALGVLALLFVIDLVGDKIVVIDHVLHVVGIIIAPASGAIVVSAQNNLLSQSNPWLVAGAGVVLGGSIHLGRSAVRPVVSATTGGAGNPVVSAVEDVIALSLTVLAILIPVLSFLLLVALVVWAVKLVQHRRAKKQTGAAGGAGVAHDSDLGDPGAEHT